MTNENTQNISKGICSKFIFGDLGLPTTFWLLGVIPAQFLNYIITLKAEPWHWLFFTTITFLHACVIPMAVWNAANKYDGKKIWAILAKTMAVISVLRWLIFLPSLIKAYSAILKIV